MATGIVFTERFLEHRPSFYHPENPDRLVAIVEHLKRVGLWSNLEHLEFGPAKPEEVSLVHDPGYVEYVQRFCSAGGGVLDYGDTYAAAVSYDVALLAVGGALSAVAAVTSGRLKNAFCLLRPPGHHAERERAMGFCIFNNVAVAARYAQRSCGLERVLIVDFDVHHGNGTQNAFWEDPTVFYVSLHQFPHYPGTGRKDEIGGGSGLGYTRNFPLPPDAPEEKWLEVVGQDIPEIANHFRPNILLVSAGFDAHKHDPLSSQNLTTKGYGQIAERLIEVAETHCDGRMVVLLEGGYNLQALAESVEAFIRAMIRS